MIVGKLVYKKGHESAGKSTVMPLREVIPKELSLRGVYLDIPAKEAITERELHGRSVKDRVKGATYIKDD